MAQSSRSLLAVGGVILAGSLLAALNPRTVRAVETAAAAVKATLVQVTNTASNPVVTQSVGQQAGQMLHVVCSGSSSGTCTFFSLGAVGQPFTVPTGESFVVTGADLLPTQPESGCSVVHEDGLFTSSGQTSGYSQLWVVNDTTLHASYPSGLVFPAGTSMVLATIYFVNTPSACTSDFYDQLDLYGYLTAS